jgi:hypothetical protein
VPLRDRLREDLESLDRNYQASKDQFWVNKNGTLGYPVHPSAGDPVELMTSEPPYFKDKDPIYGK